MLLKRVCLKCFWIWVLASLPFLCDAQKLIDAGTIYSMYEDVPGKLSFKEISDPKFSSNFKPLKTNAFWHDVTHSSIWIRFKAPYGSRHFQQFLELSCPNFAEVEFYQPNVAKAYQKFSAGMLSNFDSRPIPIDRFAFPITNGDEWHYIKLRTEHYMNTEFYIKTIEEVINDASGRNLLYILYMGLILAVIAGALFYTYLIRFYRYLYYVGYLVCLSSLLLMERAYYFQLFWPNHPSINYCFPLLPFGTCFFMLLFLKVVWIQNKFVTILYQISLWLFTLIPFLYAVYLLFNQRYAEAALTAQYQSLLVVTIVIVLTLISLANADKSLKLPLILINLGFCILCICGLILIATLNHLLPTNFFTDNALIFGSIIEVGFLTAALMIRSEEIYKTQKLKFSHHAR
jgi:hypothetical protein